MKIIKWVGNIFWNIKKNESNQFKKKQLFSFYNFYNTPPPKKKN